MASPFDRLRKQFPDHYGKMNDDQIVAELARKHGRKESILRQKFGMPQPATELPTPDTPDEDLSFYNRMRKGVPTKYGHLSDQEIFDKVYAEIGEPQGMSRAVFTEKIGLAPEQTTFDKVLGTVESFAQGVMPFTDEIADFFAASAETEVPGSGMGLASMSQFSPAVRTEADVAQASDVDRIYDEIRAQRASREERYRESAPVLGPVAEVLGGVTGAAITGAGPVMYGALHGAGGQEGGIEERLVGAGTGAATGAALNAMTAPVTQAVGRVKNLHPRRQKAIGEGIKKAAVTLDRFSRPLGYFANRGMFRYLFPYAGERNVLGAAGLMGAEAVRRTVPRKMFDFGEKVAFRSRASAANPAGTIAAAAKEAVRRRRFELTRQTAVAGGQVPLIDFFTDPEKFEDDEEE